MKTCKTKIKLIDYHYGDIAGHELSEIEAHISECPLCAEELRRIEETTGIMSRRSRPRPDRALISSYHQNLSSIYKEDSWYQQLLDSWIRVPSFGVRLAELTAVLLLGFVLGRFLFVTPAQQPLAQQSVVDAKLLNNYLFETELLLLETANMDAYHELKYIMDDIDCQQLLQKTMILKEVARKDKNVRLEHLLDRLEIILLEVSNIKDDVSNEELEYVKKSIKDMRIFSELKEIQLVNVS
ncbi:MAG: hypothetical protein V2J62_10670 [candidate division KSB1 bacterium]|jgi:hypothetical protein|nr:hypothetical protein [candidate division KSB1 bacterium]